MCVDARVEACGHGLGEDVVMAGLPTGTVTMVFTDVEGSTMLLSRLGSPYADALDAHRRVLGRAWAAHGGTEMGTEGDSFFVVFASAPDAVAAVGQAQRELAQHPWPAGEVVRVRMGVHTGSPILHDEHLPAPPRILRRPGRIGPSERAGERGGCARDQEGRMTTSVLVVRHAFPQVSGSLGVEPPVGIEPTTFSLRALPGLSAAVRGGASSQVRAPVPVGGVRPDPSPSGRFAD